MGKSIIANSIIYLLLFYILIGWLIGCLGKTSVRNIYYISPKKRTVFIAPPVNYTKNYLLDDRVRKGLIDYFNSKIRFSVVNNAQDSHLYVLIYINDYQQRTVADYGFGNTELKFNTTLFVSDSQYQNKNDDEQVGRYYFNNRSVNIEIINNVDEESTEYTTERMEKIGINKLVQTIHSLMETGKAPIE